MELFGRTIDGSGPPLVVAELSANHRHDLGIAIESIRVAAECGVDAVKFQHFTADGLTVQGDHPDLRVASGSLWENRTLYDLYVEAAMPWEWTNALVEEASRVGISWFSSPFDLDAVDFLVANGVEAIKIASFELVDLPLIRRAAHSGLPLVMSTGMATTAEVDAALSAASEEGNTDVVLLRCNSTYPASPSEMDLMTILDMKSRWSLPIGLSDHTTDSISAVVATALGACLIEKHFTLDRSLGGPDAPFSLEPDQLRELVRSVREAHSALGSVRYGPSQDERASLQFRRSLRALGDIDAGELITSGNVGSRRPAGGLAPERLEDVLGRKASRSIRKGEPILETDVDFRTGGQGS